LLAPSGDASQLAGHVVALLADPARRRAMGEAGRRVAVARYGLARLVDDIDGLYREVVGSTAGNGTSG